MNTDTTKKEIILPNLLLSRAEEKAEKEGMSLHNYLLECLSQGFNSKLDSEFWLERKEEILAEEILDEDLRPNSDTVFIAERITEPKRVLEIISTLPKRWYCANRTTLIGEKNVVDADMWWFSDSRRRIAQEILKVEIYLDDPKDWGEEFQLDWVAYSGLPKEDFKKYHPITWQMKSLTPKNDDYSLLDGIGSSFSKNESSLTHEEAFEQCWRYLSVQLFKGDIFHDEYSFDQYQSFSYLKDYLEYWQNEIEEKQAA